MAAMKDSGIEWIGEIPEEWGTAKLGPCTYMKGRIGWQGLRFDDFVDEGPFLVTGTDFADGKVDWSRCYHINDAKYAEDPAIHLREGDLLFTKDGTVGKLAYIDRLPGPASLNSHLLVLRSQDGTIDGRYLFWMLQSPIFNRYKLLVQHGSVMDSISQTDMSHLIIPLPDHEEQRAIACHLDELVGTNDSALKKAEKQISTLERYRASVIHEAVTKGLDPAAPTKPSGVDWIGDIPENWSTNKLKHIATRIFDGPFGSHLTGSDYSDEGIRVVRLENIRFMSFDESKESFVTAEKYRTISAHTVYPSDLIMATFVEDGVKVCELPPSIPFAVNKSDCVGIRLLPAVDKRFVHYWLSSSKVHEYLLSQLHGATRGRVNTEQIRGIPVLLPPLEEQRDIAAFLDRKCSAICAVLDTKRKQLDVLKARRQSLIYEYVTGKRRVSQEA